MTPPFTLGIFGGWGVGKTSIVRDLLSSAKQVKELAETAHEVGATVAYDAAHVAGLIAAGCFQDPLREGADAVTLSTHKTLFGPQHGGVLSWEKYADKIKRGTFPGMVSNHHLHALAGVTIACAEMLEFGEE